MKEKNISRRFQIGLTAFLTLALLFIVAIQGRAQEEAKERVSLAPYVPSPMEIVDKMLEMAGVTSKDVVYDLGCGDGRIVVEAAKKYGAKGVGIDMNDDRIKEAKENVAKAGVEKLVTIVQNDVMKVDISEATVITCYLLPRAMQKLKPKFAESLKEGTRIVSHDYSIDGWNPDKYEAVNVSTDYFGSHTIYMYVLKKEMKEEK